MFYSQRSIVAVDGERGTAMAQQDEDFEIDAADLAPLLKLKPAQVAPLMRRRQITAVCEKGIGDDEGLFRLTFFHGSTRARLVIGPGGRILKRSAVHFAGSVQSPGLPGAAHLPQPERVA